MIKLGIDNIDKELKYFEGKRVGLITNPTGINSEYKSTIDILNEKAYSKVFRLVLRRVLFKTVWRKSSIYNKEENTNDRN